MLADYEKGIPIKHRPGPKPSNGNGENIAWRGNAYHERGEKQLWDYLDYYHLKKGYMLSFNFNKKKELGVREIVLGDKVLVEAVV